MKKLLLSLIFILASTQAYAQNSSSTALCKSPTGTKIPVACDSGGNVGPAAATVNATFAPQTIITAATLNAAYQTVVDLPDGTKSVSIDNQTNGDVQISMTGGASDTYHVKAGDVVKIPLATLGLVTTAIVQAKDGTTASASGSLYVYSIK